LPQAPGTTPVRQASICPLISRAIDILKLIYQMPFDILPAQLTRIEAQLFHLLVRLPAIGVTNNIFHGISYHERENGQVKNGRQN